METALSSETSKQTYFPIRCKNTDTYLLIKNLLYSNGSYHSKRIDREVNIMDPNRKVRYLNAGSTKHRNLVVGDDALYSRISGFELYPKVRFLGCTSLLWLSASRQIHDGPRTFFTHFFEIVFRH
jgi:hypothetical protein